MDAGSKNLFRDRSNAKNYEPNLKTEVGQKGKTFPFERRNLVHNGTKQKNV